jgi:hypothetical protein
LFLIRNKIYLNIKSKKFLNLTHSNTKMKTIIKDFEVQIGHIFYSFTIEFRYYPGTHSIDPTEGEDSELISWDFDGPIHAFDMSKNLDYQVSNQIEISVIKEYIDIYDLFDQAIS